MYSSFGPITQLVKAFGVENPPQWLADYDWAMPAIILMTIWSNVGVFYVDLYLFYSGTATGCL